MKRFLPAVFAVVFAAILFPAQAQNLITTVAGTNLYFQGEGSPGNTVPLGRVAFVAVDPQGRAVFSDPYYNLVVRVETNGRLHVIAGNNVQGLGGASVSGSGAFAGSAGGFSGDKGLAISAALNRPAGIAYDSRGNLYIADSYNNRIRVVDTSGIITTLAGSGNAGFRDGDAANAQFKLLQDIAVDSSGAVIVNDAGGHRIRKISQGVVSTIAGNGSDVPTVPVPENAIATAVALGDVEGLATDGQGNVYFSDFGANYVREITADLRLHTIAGNGNKSATGTPGEGGPALQAPLYSPSGLAIDGSGAIYVSVTNNQLIRKIVNGTITTIAGSSASGFAGDGGAALKASFYDPFGVAVSSTGTVYVADRDNFRIRQINTAKNISSIAGNGALVFAADGKQAINAPLFDPFGVTLDSDGSLLVADTHNDVVRRIDGARILTTIAGTGALDDFIDNVPATSAGIAGPVSTSRDADGNLLIADLDGPLVRQVAASTNVIKNFLASKNLSNPGSFRPTQAVVDNSKNTYVADYGNGVIRIVRPDQTNGIFKSGLNGPFGLAIDNQNNLYVTEYKGGLVTMINIATGATMPIAGGGTAAGSDADGRPATSAMLKHPAGITVDAAHNVYFTDAGDNRVRRLTPSGSTWTISTVAGNGQPGYSGDGGISTSASLNVPYGVAVDANGTVYVADTGNNRIRAVQAVAPVLSLSTSSLAFTAIQDGTISDPLTVDVRASAFGNLAGMLFTATPSQPWISVTPTTGATPSTLQITIDPTGLAPKTYNETVTIKALGASPPVQTISINVTVSSPPPPDLHLDNVLDTPIVINAGFNAGAQPLTQQVKVLNRGGGQPQINAAATNVTGAGWLSVSPATSVASASTPATLTITINPANLAPGAYIGRIAVSSGGKQIGTVPVNIAVSDKPSKLLLSSTSVNFTAVKGGSAPIAKTLDIVNAGTGSMTWQASGASLAANSPNWLSLDSKGATLSTSQSAFSTIHASVDPAALAALDVGTYYGQIQVTSATASNSPQFVTVVLNVVDASANPGPDVSTTALVFPGAQGANPSSQTIQVSNTGPLPISYGSSRISPDGDWIVQVPTDATIAPGQTGSIVVQPDFTNLSAGSHRGTITLRFSDASGAMATRTIDVIGLVGLSGSATAEGRSRRVPHAIPACPSPNALVITVDSPPQNFSIPARQAVTIQASVRDCKGNPMPPSTGVYATFAGAGTPVSLDHIHDAIWSKSWTPSAAQSVSFFLSANWFAPGNGDNSQVGLTSPNTTGTVTSGNAPIATRLVNAASFAENEPLPPGALVTISGSDLASDTVVADKLPFNSTLAGASIKLGGVALPILYASSTQINAQLPYDLPSDAQLLVQRGDASGSPIPFIVGRAQPGIFTTNSQGKGQGAVVFATDPYTYVGPSSLPFPARPAKKGDYLTVYCTGLGAVGLDQSTHTAVPPGAASLGPAPTIDSATASIGGIDAPVSYSGLSPGNPGLYQVNVQVPAGVTAGDAVRLTITISGLTSPPVTIAVQ